MSMETDDPVKSRLLLKATQHRNEIKDEVKEISERTQKVLTNAVLVGGALALTYFLVRGFTGSKKKKRKAKAAKKIVDNEEEEYEEEFKAPSMAASMLSEIGTTIATQASALLIDLAKEKLAEYLQERANQKDDDSN